jgi:NAD(P)-dependent dehydrogenase (short-subunit alcohol dehydrogenase family)
MVAVRTFELDVRDRVRFAEVADEVEDTLGPVSLLFNNAGVAGAADVTEMSYEIWDWVIGVNVIGVINGIQTFVPRMVDRGGDAHIVNTSSGLGLVPGSAFMYATSKFAVVGLSESLRHELGKHGIGISVLCPARVATSIVQNTVDLRPVALEDPTGRVAAQLARSHSELSSGTSPDDVGEMVLRGIRANAMHIYTDTVMAEPIRIRTQMLLEAIPAQRIGDPS